MSLQITLPFGNPTSTKNLVFSILSHEYPLRIVELSNLIRKRYGKSVTFQAVRKAVLELVQDKVLVQEEKQFLINKAWVKESKEHLDRLYQLLTQTKTQPATIDSLQGEISVFSFTTLHDMMQFWYSLMDEFLERMKPGDVNSYQSAHAWEAILYANQEQSIMKKYGGKKIKSYFLTTGTTPLDKQFIHVYKKLGMVCRQAPSMKSFDRTHVIGTYGEMLVQVQLTDDMARRLDAFFRKTKSLEDMNLLELTKIAETTTTVKMTVIRNEAMAKQINKSIIDQIE